MSSLKLMRQARNLQLGNEINLKRTCKLGSAVNLPFYQDTG
jgi:hypothetical protein